jgi:hypothetical protein
MLRERRTHTQAKVSDGTFASKLFAKKENRPLYIQIRALIFFLSREFFLSSSLNVIPQKDIARRLTQVFFEGFMPPTKPSGGGDLIVPENQKKFRGGSF